jgi:hypothetical protein
MDVQMTRHPGVCRDPDPEDSWIPACAGMTIALCVRYVNAPECITRSN